MNDLRISLVQTPLLWEDPSGNRQILEQKIKGLGGKSDLVVLPEMFTTGFSMNAEQIAEKYGGEHTLNWMKSLAGSERLCLCGSVSVEEEGQYYNRLFFVFPYCSFEYYDKRHLFTFAGEHEHYSGGNKRLIVEWKGWKICLLICYDLRFPVWSRNLMREDGPLFDLQIYVANWPAVRSDPWKKLLFARAIENQCYVAGVNRVGSDGNEIEYSGDSLLINPKGQVLENPGNIECIRTTPIDFAALNEFRKKFPVLEDADDFDFRP